MRELLAFILLVSWLVGIVIAKGFWSVLFACIMPFYAWYLVVEKFMFQG